MLHPEITTEPLVGLYTLYYRRAEVGNHILTKNFRFNGSLKEAIERAQLHCSVMGARFSFVQPLIADLTLEESYKIGNKIPDQQMVQEPEGIKNELRNNES